MSSLKMVLNEIQDHALFRTPGQNYVNVEGQILLLQRGEQTIRLDYLLDSFWESSRRAE